jgi:hypothetical protein
MTDEPDRLRDRIDELFDRHDDNTVDIYFDTLEAVLQLCDGDGLCPIDGVCTVRAPRTCPAGMVRDAMGVALWGNRDG